MTSLEQKKQNLIDLSPMVRTLCEPLSNFLGIKYFRYVRSYKDNTKFCICTHEDWLKAYFEQEFYNVELANYHKMPDNAKGISLHGGCDDDNVICKFWNSMANLCEYNYILAIYEKNDEYFDLFNFAVMENTHVASNIFLNNRFLFNHFIMFFYDEGEMLIHEADENRFEVSPVKDFKVRDNWLLGLNEKEEEEILAQMKINRMYLTHKKDSDYLDSNEAKILKLLVRGYSEEQIAKFFKIPTKTISSYLAHTHKKMGTKNNIELMRMFLREPLSSRLANFYLKQ